MLSTVSAIVLLALTPDAQACGGFFCNNIDPVEQAGEDIVFEVDADNNQTTMHVQVEYSGPAAEFAWIVPVKGTPDLMLSNDALFQTMRQWTQPQFNLMWDFEGECYWGWDEDAALNAGGGGPLPPAAPEEDGVDILAQETVGPYDTVTLSADSSEQLLTWLQDNEYFVPDALGPVLDPYVGDDHNFVALRLTKGAGTGDLSPLALRYEGTKPAIPIQLTSVAATPDMQLVAYVLGPDRAVPTNYLHVQLNEAAVDWFSFGSNYQEVLTAAADEAGGHAFATDFSGSTDNFKNLFYDSSWENLALEESTSPSDFLNRVIFSGIPASSTILEIFQTHIAVGEGYDAQSVYNCPDCYTSELQQWNPDFDAVAAAQEMNDRVIDPLYEIDQMFDRADHITRLGSTVSPVEMTVDPEFGFNDIMEQDVPNWHEARLVFDCEDGTDPNGYFDTWNAPKTLVLSDGTEIRIPSDQWLSDHGMTASEYLANLQEPAAAIIEQTSETAGPVVIFDGTDIIDEFIDDHNNQTENLEGKGCGCNSATGGFAAAWLLGLLPLLARRRR